MPLGSVRSTLSLFGFDIVTIASPNLAVTKGGAGAGRGPAQSEEAGKDAGAWLSRRVSATEPCKGPRKRPADHQYA